MSVLYTREFLVQGESLYLGETLVVYLSRRLRPSGRFRVIRRVQGTLGRRRRRVRVFSGVGY
jgi:hypothetical protein